MDDWSLTDRHVFLLIFQNYSILNFTCDPLNQQFREDYVLNIVDSLGPEKSRDGEEVSSNFQKIFLSQK